MFFLLFTIECKVPWLSNNFLINTVTYFAIHSLLLYLGHLFLVVFSFSKKLPIVVLDVCPPVCPSVICRNIFFRGNCISNNPIALKLGLNVS